MLAPQIAIVPDSILAASEAADVAGKLEGLAAALQIQVDKHFGPLWQITGTVSYFKRLEDAPAGFWPIIISDDIGDQRALGFHVDDKNQPLALVRYSPDWTLTASHELLEMLADPWGNRLIAGPSIDDTRPNDQVRYLLEVCDPVEDVSFAYTINGFLVSDFITPAYHNPVGSANDRYDYMGKLTAPRQVLENGYISWEDLSDGTIRQLQVKDGGKHSIGVVRDGTFDGVRSLREAVNAVTPPPSAAFRSDASTALLAADRQEGVRRASAARANRLRSVVRSISSRQIG